MSYQQLSKPYAAYLNTITNQCEPQSFSRKQVAKKCAEMQCRKSFMLSVPTTLGVWLNFHQEKRQLVANGFTRSNFTLIDQLKGIKLGWWLEDSLKLMPWTTRKHSLQLLR